MATSTPGLTPSQLNYSDAAQFLQIVKQQLDDTRCASPGFLTKDLQPNQTVTVQLAVQERVRTPQGQRWWDVPPIVNVPILVPRGGGFAVTLPLKKGDSGMLIFCDACFDLWWKNGQQNGPPAANTGVVSGSQRQFEVRRHHVHDCGFLPGMWSQKNLLSNYSTTSLQVRADDGSAIVDVSSSNIKITANTKVELVAPLVEADNGGSPLALMTEAWQLWFTTNVLPHITTGVIPPPPSPTSVLKGE